MRVGEWCYTVGNMAKEITFQLDIKGAEAVLTDMAQPLVQKSAQAISHRADGIAAATSSKAPAFSVTTEVGTIKRGRRAIATVKADFNNPRESYIVHNALVKAKDAGRV